MIFVLALTPEENNSSLNPDNRDLNGDLRTIWTIQAIDRFLAPNLLYTELVVAHVFNQVAIAFMPRTSETQQAFILDISILFPGAR